jgi:hypothetical protein
MFTHADLEDGYEQPPVAPWERKNMITVELWGDKDVWGNVTVGPVSFNLTDKQVRQWAEVFEQRLREPIDHAAQVRGECRDWEMGFSPHPY